MTGDKFSRKLLSRLFYILFSLLVSIALWMYVEIRENRIQPHQVKNIRIVRLNEKILDDRGLLITSINPEYVTLTFECTRSVASKLRSDTLFVEIDLSEIQSRGNTTLEYNIVYPNGIDTESILDVRKSVEEISLYVDRTNTIPVPVEVSYKGGTAEGFIQDPIDYNPHVINISGPAEVVSTVSKAHVNILRENLTATYTDDLTFTLIDENGEEVDKALLGQITFSDETIHITIPIRATKEVALTVDFNFGSGATQQNTVFSINPPTVLIAGDPEAVRDFNSITLGTVDLTRYESTYTDAFPIVIPNVFTNLSGETQALVLYEILGLEIKYLSVSNIQVINKPVGTIADFITQNLDVRIRGRAEDLAQLTETNIRVVANLSEAGLGTQRIPARVYVDGIEGDVGPIGNYWIAVTLKKET